MYKVEVYKIVEDKEEIAFTVKYNDETDTVIMQGVPPDLIRTWEKFGIPKGPGKVVKPDDGLSFLRAVSLEFKGSMSRSSRVMEEE